MRVCTVQGFRQGHHKSQYSTEVSAWLWRSLLLSGRSTVLWRVSVCVQARKPVASAPWSALNSSLPRPTAAALPFEAASGLCRRAASCRQASRAAEAFGTQPAST